MKKRHYVNNVDFYNALVEFKMKTKESDDFVAIPRYIGACINEICKRLSTKANFVNYTYRDEMVGDAVENCVESIHGFDPKKSNNPFAYFTRIAWNAMLRRIAKEKKQTYLKYKNMQNLHLTEDAHGELHLSNDEIANEIIKSFEDKLTKTPK